MGLGLRVRCLAQGHLDTQLGGAWDRTSDLSVTTQPALPPEPHAAPHGIVLDPIASVDLLSLSRDDVVFLGEHLGADLPDVLHTGDDQHGAIHNHSTLLT